MRSIRIETIREKFDDFLPPQKGENDDKSLINASVLIPFVYHEQELALLFTHRSNRLKNHRGQVSFPGGMQEHDDPDLIQTALRETWEEIGISPKQVDVFGSLNPLQSPFGYSIHPFLGFIRNLDGIHKNVNEVERIFCVPVKWLLDPANFYQEDYRPSGGSVRQVWIYKDYDGERIWGITADILHQLSIKLK